MELEAIFRVSQTYTNIQINLLSFKYLATKSIFEYLVIRLTLTCYHALLQLSVASSAKMMGLASLLVLVLVLWGRQERSVKQVGVPQFMMS